MRIDGIVVKANPIPPFLLSSYERGWLEALIDGEGSLMLIKQKSPQASHGYYYRPMVSISNKSYDLMQRIVEICRGHGCVIRDGRNHVRNQERNAVCYYYHIPANVLRIILPQLHFIIKERQRVLLLEALEHTNHRTRTGEPIGGDKWMRLESIYNEIKLLNRKGPAREDARGL